MTAPQMPGPDASVPAPGAVKELGDAQIDATQARNPSDVPPAGVPVAAAPVGAQTGAPADFPPSTEAGRGLFGVHGTGDTSGFGGLMRRRTSLADSPRPYGSYFDEVVDALTEAFPGASDAIQRVVVDRGELTLHIEPEHT